MAALLHAMVPLKVPEVTPKLDYIRAHRDSFDVVFIGSSRVYHGISPRFFDAAMDTANLPVHSFNLAVNAMYPPESFALIDTLLALRPARLKLVILEAASEAPAPDPSDLNFRDFYFQDYSALLHGARRAWLTLHAPAPAGGLEAAWNQCATTAATVTRNEFNIGRVDLTAYVAKTPNRQGRVMLGPDQDGYLPERHPLSQGSRAMLAKNLEAMRTGAVKDRPRDPLNSEGYSRVRALLAGRGIQLLLLAPPSTTKDFHAWVDAPPGTRLLRFDDPLLHPELYTPEHRLDSDHLNDDGARIFSLELAQACLSGSSVP